MSEKLASLLEEIVESRLASIYDDELRQAAAALRELSTPEWFNDWEDPEYGFGDYADALDECNPDEIRRLTGSRSVWNKWVATRCLSLDDGDPGDTEVVAFDTKAEAEKCWAESLAALRNSGGG